MSVQDRKEVLHNKKGVIGCHNGCQKRPSLLVWTAIHYQNYHGRLQWLMRFKNCEGQIARWLEVLSAYTLTIVHVHRAGRVHKNADSLSHRPCYSNDCKHCDRYKRRLFLKVSPEIDRTGK